MREDIVGRQSLEILEKAEKYLELSSMDVGRHLHGEVLELGCGTGNLTAYLAFSHEITAIDINPDYLTRLKSKIRLRENLLGIQSKSFKTLLADLTNEPHPKLLNNFNTLFSSQVLEHFEDDLVILKRYCACLKKEGKVVLKLPAMPFAFSILDKNLGHYRRYSRKSAEELLRLAGLEVTQSYYFNFIGLLGWVYAGKILKKRILPLKELSFFNSFAGFFLKFDLLFSKFLGLNVVVVGRKSKTYGYLDSVKVRSSL